MPSRNIERQFVEDSFYHVYNRGVNKRRIFMDDVDYAVFLNLLKRYLSDDQAQDVKGREYISLQNDVELVSFCLMPNHFHLLLYLHTPTGITQLLRNVTTSYSVYFNKRHGRVGHLFQERFKASMIDNEGYLHHISRYIHLNPVGFRTWEYSSLPYYLGTKSASWVKPERILELFKNREEYNAFVNDYAANDNMLEEIESELAG